MDDLHEIQMLQKEMKRWEWSQNISVAFLIQILGGKGDDLQYFSDKTKYIKSKYLRNI